MRVPEGDGVTENKIERWISYAQWKADELNRLFKEQGVTGQLGSITPETIRHGSEANASRQKVGV